MTYHKNDHGFSIIDLIVAVAIVGVLSAVAVPNFQRWSRSYKLQSAVTDLYSHMQMAKLGSVKENKRWNINFNPGALLGYEIRNSAGKLIKTVDFRVRYNGDMLFTDPTGTKVTDPALGNIMAFDASGLSNQGYAYISNIKRSKYYRVGLPFITGSIRIEQWNGSVWQ